MAIGVLVLLRIELYIIVHHRREGDVGKVLHLEEPLCRIIEDERLVSNAEKMGQYLQEGFRKALR